MNDKKEMDRDKHEKKRKEKKNERVIIRSRCVLCEATKQRRRKKKMHVHECERGLNQLEGRVHWSTDC